MNITTGFYPVILGLIPSETTNLLLTIKKKIRMKQKNHKQNFCGLNNRRIMALKNLEECLKLDHKNTKTGAVPLTPEDKTRIQKEINILQSRIVSDEVAKATRHKKKKN